MPAYTAGDSARTCVGTYYAHPEHADGGCKGCAGDMRGGVCSSLPIGCSYAPRIIWRTDPYIPPVTADKYKPAHGGYPGTVRLS